ncbi:hypothetical protein C8F04DRAFT_1181341 [Mycena alexandri]|uniref:Uncharacterized protein n=1 Tax=Mycena alexandri TaxID=1745969 RepID=A0AAD6T2F0_9AGAR|nr:hypothetical protein C8F04DRAFT_1181341 [Mycena alexandri]
MFTGCQKFMGHRSDIPDTTPLALDLSAHNFCSKTLPAHASKSAATWRRTTSADRKTQDWKPSVRMVTFALDEHFHSGPTFFPFLPGKMPRKKSRVAPCRTRCDLGVGTERDGLDLEISVAPSEVAPLVNRGEIHQGKEINKTSCRYLRRGPKDVIIKNAHLSVARPSPSVPAWLGLAWLKPGLWLKFSKLLFVLWAYNSPWLINLCFWLHVNRSWMSVGDAKAWMMPPFELLKEFIDFPEFFRPGFGLKKWQADIWPGLQAAKASAFWPEAEAGPSLSVKKYFLRFIRRTLEPQTAEIVDDAGVLSIVGYARGQHFATDRDREVEEPESILAGMEDSGNADQMFVDLTGFLPTNCYAIISAIRNRDAALTPCTDLR